MSKGLSFFSEKSTLNIGLEYRSRLGVSHLAHALRSVPVVSLSLALVDVVVRQADTAQPLYFPAWLPPARLSEKGS
jgi:hypothetical protein